MLPRGRECVADVPRCELLKSIQIKGFKTLVETELEFGRVNMFIGGNGAGKSNILEALGLLSASLKDVSDAELQRRGVRLSAPTLFKSAFKNTKIRNNFDLKAIFENEVCYRVTIGAGENFGSLRFVTENIEHAGRRYMGRGPAGVRIFGQNVTKRDVDPTRGLWDRFRESAELPDALFAELNRMANYAIFAPQTAFLRGSDIETVLTSPMGLQGGNLAQAFLGASKNAGKKSASFALFKEILGSVWGPGWTESVLVQEKKEEVTSKLVKTGSASLYLTDKYMIRTRNQLSAYDSSEGTLYLLFIAVLLGHPETPKIFALDNVDNALNPKMTREMLSLLIRVACEEKFRKVGMAPDQIFLTSHNPTALDAFDIFDDEQRVFVVARDQVTGQSKVIRLMPPAGMDRQEWIEAKEGRTLSELWIEGRIEGALGL